MSKLRVTSIRSLWTKTVTWTAVECISTLRSCDWVSNHAFFVWAEPHQARRPLCKSRPVVAREPDITYNQSHSSNRSCTSSRDGVILAPLKTQFLTTLPLITLTSQTLVYPRLCRQRNICASVWRLRWPTLGGFAQSVLVSWQSLQKGRQSLPALK